MTEGSDEDNWESVQISNQGTLQLKLNIQFGNGVSSNAASALVRPFNRTIKKFKPPGTIAWIFHQDSGRYSVLGSFVYSASHKIVFYPGLVGKIESSSFSINRQGSPQKLHVDHLTLEKDLSKWHITLPERETYGIRLNTQHTAPYSSETSLWFVFRFKTMALEACPKTQTISVPISRGLEPIAKMISSSVKSFPVIQLENDVVGFFWQVEVFISKCKADPLDKIPSIAIPTPGITSNIETPLHARTYPVRLDGFPRYLYLRLSKIVGTLSDDAYIISLDQNFFKKTT